MRRTNEAAAKEIRDWPLAWRRTLPATIGDEYTPAFDAAPRETVRVAGSGLTLAADIYGPDDAPTVMPGMHGGGQTRHAWEGQVQPSHTLATEPCRSTFEATAIATVARW